jgi:myosin heavy subunit
LVSVNPYQVLPDYYGNKQLQSFIPTSPAEPQACVPHIYGIAASAYQGLLAEGKDQSVLIRYNTILYSATLRESP